MDMPLLAVEIDFTLRSRTLLQEHRKFNARKPAGGLARMCDSFSTAKTLAVNGSKFNCGKFPR